MTDLFKKIKAFLDEHNVVYDVAEHEPTPTSADSAKARGTTLKTGAKALLIKGNEKFVLCIMPADKRLDTKKLKSVLNAKKIRFATIEELKELTGCDKGAMPPFNHFFSFDMIVDPQLFEEEFMDFNAGSLEHSIKMKTADYDRIVKPRKEEIVEA